jgi:hypothetical protein
MDDNLFDEDNALDYIIYEDCNNNDTKHNNRTGCLSTFILLFIPLASVTIISNHLCF